MKAYIFLADGFEEIEALTTVDVLRRAQVDAVTVSVTSCLSVEGAHGIPVVSDMILEGQDLEDADLLVLPGGMPGAKTLSECAPLASILRKASKDGHTYIAAICAAPMVLGQLGLLKGEQATCYPGFEPMLIDAVTTGEMVEVSHRFITGKGPGASLDFALTIVGEMLGQETKSAIASAMCHA